MGIIKNILRENIFYFDLENVKRIIFFQHCLSSKTRGLQSQSNQHESFFLFKSTLHILNIESIMDSSMGVSEPQRSKSWDIIETPVPTESYISYKRLIPNNVSYMKIYINSKHAYTWTCIHDIEFVIAHRGAIPNYINTFTQVGRLIGLPQ